MDNNLKVYLKFHESNGDMVGFVTKKNNLSWVGCNESDPCGKMVVVLGKNLQDISEGVLYKTTLRPMKNKKGFVAISATPVQFTAKIDTFVHRNNFKVIVSFGNKKVEYSTYTQNPKKNDVNAVIFQLKVRKDLKDKERVIRDFSEAVMSATNLVSANVG